jgi:lysyl-tRNA synthetase class 2
MSSLFWRPDRHADRRPFLLARGRIKSAIRSWFEAQGFVEVDTACLQLSPGNETHLHAFKTELVGTDLTRTPLYLHTSPEFAMKKLLAGGEERIFTFAPCFRNRERGALHSPEFTMLEWYRAGAPYEQLWDDCIDILHIAAETAGRPRWELRGRACEATRGTARTSLDEAFLKHAGIPLQESYDEHGANRDALARLALARGIRFVADDTWSDIFSKVLVERIEPRLGAPCPEVLYEYPLSEAALARPKPDRPAVAERFELYACGIELANGFGELTDAAAQRARFEADMEEKRLRYGERYPIDEDFLAALAHMPPASGCALGFDRLVLLATGATHIDQVLWTPLPEESK